VIFEKELHLNDVTVEFATARHQHRVRSVVDFLFADRAFKRVRYDRTSMLGVELDQLLLHGYWAHI
jgi:hypothetical protein